MDCFAIHLFFPSSSRREAEKGCREQCSLLGYGQSPITLPRWIASQSICSFLFQIAAKRRKGAGNNVPCWGMGRQPHHSPSMDCIAIHPSPPSSNCREAKKGCREQVPCWGMGQSPIVPHRPPVPRPRHSMRTFRPSIIAARALRENASNCLSVMCSIRLSGFTEPAAVVLAVGTP